LCFQQTEEWDQYLPSAGGLILPSGDLEIYFVVLWSFLASEDIHHFLVGLQDLLLEEADGFGLNAIDLRLLTGFELFAEVELVAASAAVDLKLAHF